MAEGGAAAGAGGAAGTTLLAWSARGRSLCVAGAAPVLRLWDAGTELLHHTIKTGTPPTTRARDGVVSHERR